VSYTVEAAHGTIVRVLSAHPTRKDALRAMQRVSGTIVAVREPGGRIVATNLKRSM